MARRIRPARAYQSPTTPVRVLADRAIPGIRRALKTALMVTRRRFDKAKAAEMLRRGDVAGVLDLLDLHHQMEALRRPLGMLGDVWLDGAAIGARKINGSFASKRRLVRYKKAATEGTTPVAARHDLEINARNISLEDWMFKNAVHKDAADQFAFYRFDPVVQELIYSYQEALLVQLSGDIKATVAQIIIDAMNRGGDVDAMADEIRAIIGLTASQARAVENFRQAFLTGKAAARALMDPVDAAILAGLRSSGDSPTQSQADEAADRYADNYLTYRADTIAKTEATRAASLGLQSAYQQAADRGVMPEEAVTQHWQIALDEKVCPICLGLYDANPEGVPLGETFQSPEGDYDAPPAHPNCRCTLDLVTNLDLVPDDFGEEINSEFDDFAKFDPSEPRDDHGQWTSSGGGDVTGKPGRKLTEAQKRAMARDWSVNAGWENFQITARAIQEGQTREEFIAHQHGARGAGIYYDRTAAALNAINNGPDIPVPVYRGIAIGENYAVGDTFSESLSSWTGDRSLAEKFATGYFGDRSNHALVEPTGSSHTPAIFDDITSHNSKGFNLSDHMTEAMFGDNEHAAKMYMGAQEWLTSGQYRVAAISDTGGVRTIQVERIGPAVSNNVVKREFAKYDATEPRDEIGRWTAGGTLVPQTEQQAREFFSGNTDDLDFDAAAAALNSPDQAHIEAMSHDVDQALGLSTIDQSVIGAWSDGAENSVMTTVAGASWDDLRTSAAMKGSLANQKAVLAFRESADGTDQLVTFSARGSLADIHSAMLSDGLAFHTLVPKSGGADVVVVASDSGTRDAIDKAAGRYGSTITYRPGQAEYIGVSGDGSREDAQRAYQAVLGGSGVAGLPGIWAGLRNRWGAVAKVFRDVVKAWFYKYDPNELRDDHGRWTSGGSSAASPPADGTAPGIYASTEEAASKVKREWAEKSGIETLADAMKRAQENQDELARVAARIEQETGAEFRNPGIKADMVRMQQKIDAGRTPAQITDVVRGGFMIEHPAQADDIVRSLSRDYPVVDEGWKVTDDGYFDRKAYVRFPSGQIGEVQMWEPRMYDAKDGSGGGHLLYEQARALPAGDPRLPGLKSSMQELYGKVIASYGALDQGDAGWKEVAGKSR